DRALADPPRGGGAGRRRSVGDAAVRAAPVPQAPGRPAGDDRASGAAPSPGPQRARLRPESRLGPWNRPRRFQGPESDTTILRFCQRGKTSLPVGMNRTILLLHKSAFGAPRL